MTEAAPAHIGDMEQAIETVEVDEGAEVGDVLDGALADIARGHLAQEFAALFIAFGLQPLISSRRERTMFWRSWLILTTLNS